MHSGRARPKKVSKLARSGWEYRKSKRYYVLFNIIFFFWGGGAGLKSVCISVVTPPSLQVLQACKSIRAKQMNTELHFSHSIAHTFSLRRLNHKLLLM
jgi:hypothetical protein